MSLALACINSLSKSKLIYSNIAICTQVRWRKPPKRKPRWLPMAKSKVFRINVHPFVPPDEVQLSNDLMEEYYRHFESLRKHFQDEIKQAPSFDEAILAMRKEEEKEFKLLLEENAKENERVRLIREETLEREFQEKQLQWLQMAEETKEQQKKIKERVEEIVRIEKEKDKNYITLENLDEVIEKAIDTPVNIGFSLTLDGTVNWEGKPPLEYEEEINRRLAKAKEF